MDEPELAVPEGAQTEEYILREQLSEQYEAGFYDMNEEFFSIVGVEEAYREVDMPGDPEFECEIVGLTVTVKLSISVVAKYWDERTK